MDGPAELKAYREKEWDELNGQEKIERMRVVVKQQARTIARLIATVDRLEEHSHAGSEMLVPFSSRRGQSENLSRGDKYF